MSFLFVLATQLVPPANACAMERMEPVELVAQAATQPLASTLVDVFAEIDALAAKPVQAVEIKRSVNQARAATDVIPEVRQAPTAKPAS